MVSWPLYVWVFHECECLDHFYLFVSLFRIHFMAQYGQTFDMSNFFLNDDNIFHRHTHCTMLIWPGHNHDSGQTAANWIFCISTICVHIYGNISYEVLSLFLPHFNIFGYWNILQVEWCVPCFYPSNFIIIGRLFFSFHLVLSAYRYNYSENFYLSLDFVQIITTDHHYNLKWSQLPES